MTPPVDAARRAGIRFELHEYSGVEHGEGDHAPADCSSRSLRRALIRTLAATTRALAA